MRSGMKRKLFIIGWALALVLGIYSITAWRVLRGAGAYRIGTTLGSVLAHSRPYVTLVAVLLLAAMVVWSVLKLKARAAAKKEALRKDEEQDGSGFVPEGPVPEEPVPEKPVSEEPVPEEPVAEESVPKQKKRGRKKAAGAKFSGSEGKIKPAGPQTGEKISPAAATTQPTEDSQTTEQLLEKPSAVRKDTEDITEFLPEGPAVGHEEVTEFLPEGPAVPDDKGATALLGEEPQNLAPARDNTVRCRNCGAVLKAGQRFCTKCGTPLSGGEAT